MNRGDEVEVMRDRQTEGVKRRKFNIVAEGMSEKRVRMRARRAGHHHNCS